MNLPASRQRSILSRGQAIGVVLFLLLMTAIWQAACVAFDVPGYILPSPLEIGRSMVDDYQILAKHTLVTVTEIGIGLATGVLTGVLLAFLMSRSETVSNALYVPILATQTTPTIAIAPILIVWFGVGLAPKVIVITIFSFFPVLVNTLAGLQATGRQMLLLMESVSASEWQIYRYVRIPMALPHFFAGLRLAAAASVIGAVVVEWVSSVEGLGYLLILHESRLNVDKAFATLIILMALGVAVFAVMALIERRFSWTKHLGVD